MPKQKPVSPLARRDSRGVISELDATRLALMMRQNAEALFLDLAGHNGALNPDRSHARELLIDVRFWHLADVQTALRNVRFEGK